MYNEFNNDNNQKEITGQTTYMQQEPYYNYSRPPYYRKKSNTAVIILCIILAFIFGVGGGYLGSRVAFSQAGDGTVVLYQSVERTTGGNTSLASKMSIADIVLLTQDSVVEIRTESVATNAFLQQYIQSGAGSGVVISANGYIVTNNHVISGADKITVTAKDGTTYSAKLIGSDKTTDLAVIKIDAADLTPIIFGDSDNIVVGETSVVIGNPLGQLGGTVTNGIISALDREISIDGQYMRLLQTNAQVNPGNSGGGLFNANGELIGIINAKSTGTGIEGLGFAIPVNIVKNVVEQLISIGYVQGRIDLGMTLVDITDRRTALYYGVSSTGVYVASVEESSNAYNAGFESGDRIISIDGHTIEEVTDVNRITLDAQVGDTLNVILKRGRQTHTLDLTLSEYKPDTKDE